MAERRRYTKRQKVTAVIAAEMSSVAAAAEEMHIPESTVRAWYDSPQFVDLRAKKADERAEGYRLLSALAQQRLVELIPVMEPPHLITLMGVAEDKAQLLAGAATSRTETTDLTGGLSPDRKRELRNMLDAAARQEAMIE